MRKILSLVLAVLLITSLSACGSDPNQDVIDRSKETLGKLTMCKKKAIVFQA